MTTPKLRRPYRLERVGDAWSTRTYRDETAARLGLGDFIARVCMPGDQWRLTLRADKGRKTTVVAEGVVK